MCLRVNSYFMLYVCRYFTLVKSEMFSAVNLTNIPHTHTLIQKTNTKNNQTKEVSHIYIMKHLCYGMELFSSFFFF